MQKSDARDGALRIGRTRKLISSARKRAPNSLYEKRRRPGGGSDLTLFSSGPNCFDSLRQPVIRHGVIEKQKYIFFSLHVLSFVRPQ